MNEKSSYWRHSGFDLRAEGSFKGLVLAFDEIRFSDC